MLLNIFLDSVFRCPTVGFFKVSPLMFVATRRDKRADAAMTRPQDDNSGVRGRQGEQTAQELGAAQSVPGSNVCSETPAVGSACVHRLVHNQENEVRRVWRREVWDVCLLGVVQPCRRCNRHLWDFRARRGPLQRGAFVEVHGNVDFELLRQNEALTYVSFYVHMLAKSSARHGLAVRWEGLQVRGLVRFRGGYWWRHCDLDD